ncbi:Activating signal cointegrator 1, partial [Mucuna pruriens]
LTLGNETALIWAEGEPKSKQSLGLRWHTQTVWEGEGMRRNHSNSGNYRNPCLTMHQPWASLLVYGIKRVEGRSWPAPITGRLWIHAASKVPDQSTIKAMEYFYKEIYALNGVTDIHFPQHYPVSRLLGCVEVVGCLTRDELACWEMVPEGVRLEAQTDYCWLCERPQKLLIPFEMRGYQGVYNLERKIYEAAARGLSLVNGPLPVKFPLPDPQDPFSLRPGSISAPSPNLKATEGDKSSSISLAIAGARAAASQFSKKDQNSSSTARNNAPANLIVDNEDTEIARSYNLRSQGRSMEKDNISSTELNEKFDDGTLPSYHEEKSSSNKSEGRSKHNQSGAEADLKQYPQPSSKLGVREDFSHPHWGQPQITLRDVVTLSSTPSKPSRLRLCLYYANIHKS